MTDSGARAQAGGPRECEPLPANAHLSGAGRQVRSRRRIFHFDRSQRLRADASAAAFVCAGPFTACFLYTAAAHAYTAPKVPSDRCDHSQWR